MNGGKTMSKKKFTFYRVEKWLVSVEAETLGDALELAASEAPDVPCPIETDFELAHVREELTDRKHKTTIYI